MSLRHTIATIALHMIILVTLYAVLYYCGIIRVIPDNNNLVNWDAHWYVKMVKAGYYYEPDRTNPLAFFPLFPLFWKISMLPPIGISIVNAMVFYIAVILLVRHLRFTFMQTLVALSTPSLFFCYIPYTEAFFFFGVTWMLIGLDKDKQSAIITGLIIATLSRSVGVVFLPAFLFIYKDQRRPLLLYSSIIVLSALLVFFIQYLYTGKWFVYFEVQRHWNRSLHIPRLPFTTFTGWRMLWLDGAALLVSLLALVLCLTRRRDKAFSFTLVYLVMIGVLCTFFSGIWARGEGTSIMSINRYVFATPFFIYFLHRMVFQVTSDKYEPLVFSGVMIGAWLLLGCYHTLKGHATYYDTVLYFVYMTVYMILYFVARKEQYLYLLIYILNMCIQVGLFSLYLQARWVG